MKREKVEFVGKLYVSLMMPNCLLFYNQKGIQKNDKNLFFEMRFPESKEMRDYFDKLLKEIDENGNEMNFYKFTIENAVTEKQVKEVREARKSVFKPDKQHYIDFWKAQLEQANSHKKYSLKRLAENEKDVAHYTKELEKAMKK
jgi:hypothetical protein